METLLDNNFQQSANRKKTCDYVNKKSAKTISNRPFPSSPEPLFQNEGRCSAFGMEIIFHSHAKKTHFHKKGCTPSLIFKVRVFGTRKWHIAKRDASQAPL